MELYFKLNKNDDLGLFSQPAINHEECKSNHLSPIPGLGQIHLPLTDGQAELSWVELSQAESSWVELSWAESSRAESS